MGLERRLEKTFDAVAAANDVRNADETGQHGADRQDDEHKRHRGRRIVEVVTAGRTGVSVSPRHGFFLFRMLRRGDAVSAEAAARRRSPWNARNTRRNMYVAVRNDV